MKEKKTIAERRKELEKIENELDTFDDLVSMIDNRLEEIICEDDNGIVFIPSDAQQEYDGLSLLRKEFVDYIEILELKYKLCAMDIEYRSILEPLCSI